MKKNNPHIKEVFPKIYFIDNQRNIGEYQTDLIKQQGNRDLLTLSEDRCMFDVGRKCNQCFECIGKIRQKSVDELSVYETAKMLEFKLFNNNLDKFASQVNKYFSKNGANSQYVKFTAKCDYDKIFELPIVCSATLWI